MSVVIYNKIKEVFNSNKFNSSFGFDDLDKLAREYKLQKVLSTLTVYTLNCYTGSFTIDGCVEFSQICFCREMFNKISRGEVELDSKLHTSLNEIFFAVYELETLAKKKGYSPCGLSPTYAPGFMGRLFSKTNLLCSCFEDDSQFVKRTLLEVYKVLDNI